ncbi:MAG: hypothetical protein IT454_11275 [Planctomycetes bacterium]|nr:hypothetical protein [Planctomycetota bacterium]
MEPFEQAALGFVTLLLLPFLGVLGLLRKRALPWLGGATAAWALAGGVYGLGLAADDPSRAPFLRAWRVGLALGLAFFAVAWIVRRPRVARGLKWAFALSSIAVFARALYLYLHAYA